METQSVQLVIIVVTHAQEAAQDVPLAFQVINVHYRQTLVLAILGIMILELVHVQVAMVTAPVVP